MTTHLQNLITYLRGVVSDKLRQDKPFWAKYAAAKSDDIANLFRDEKLRNNLEFNDNLHNYVYIISSEPDRLKFCIDDNQRCKHDYTGKRRPNEETEYRYSITLKNGTKREGTATKGKPISLRFSEEQIAEGCHFDGAKIEYYLPSHEKDKFGWPGSPRTIGIDPSIFDSIDTEKPILLLFQAGSDHFFGDRMGWISANNLYEKAKEAYGDNVIDLSNLSLGELKQFAQMAQEKLGLNNPIFHITANTHGSYSEKENSTHLSINPHLSINHEDFHDFANALPGGVSQQKWLLLNCNTHPENFTNTDNKTAAGMVVALAPNKQQTNLITDELDNGTVRVTGDIAIPMLRNNSPAFLIEQTLKKDEHVRYARGRNLLERGKAKAPLVILNNPNIVQEEAARFTAPMAESLSHLTKKSGDFHAL